MPQIVDLGNVTGPEGQQGPPGTITPELEQLRQDIEDNVQEVEDIAGDLLAEQNRLSNRLDSILNGAQSDSEVLDARVDKWGTVYQTLGSHVRKNDELWDAKASSISSKTITGNPVICYPAEGSHITVNSDTDCTMVQCGHNMASSLQDAWRTISSLSGQALTYNADRSITYFSPAGGYGITCTKNIPVKRNTQYTISFKYEKMFGNFTGCRVYLVDTSEWLLPTTSNRVFNTGENDLMYFSFYSGTPSANETMFKIWDIQMEEGSDATDYVPFVALNTYNLLANVTQDVPAIQSTNNLYADNESILKVIINSVCSESIIKNSREYFPLISSRETSNIFKVEHALNLCNFSGSFSSNQLSKESISEIWIRYCKNKNLAPLLMYDTGITFNSDKSVSVNCSTLASNYKSYSVYLPSGSYYLDLGADILANNTFVATAYFESDNSAVPNSAINIGVSGNVLTKAFITLDVGAVIYMQVNQNSTNTIILKPMIYSSAFAEDQTYEPNKSYSIKINVNPPITIDNQMAKCWIDEDNIGWLQVDNQHPINCGEIEIFQQNLQQHWGMNVDGFKAFDGPLSMGYNTLFDQNNIEYYASVNYVNEKQKQIFEESYIKVSNSGHIAQLDGLSKGSHIELKTSFIATGGNGTPDAPIPIVGKDSVTLTISGENLSNIQNIDSLNKGIYRRLANGRTISLTIGENAIYYNYNVSDLSNFTRVKMTNLLPNTAYTVSCQLSEFTGRIRSLFGTFNVEYASLINGLFIKTFTTDQNGEIMLAADTQGDGTIIYITKTANSGNDITSSVNITNIQVQKGSVATQYIQHLGYDYTIPLQEQAYGLTIANDTVDIDMHGNILFMKNTNLIEFDGTEAFNYVSNLSSENVARFNVNIADKKNGNFNMLCSHFMVVDTSSPNIYQQDTAIGSFGDSSINFFISKSSIVGWDESWSSAQKSNAFRSWVFEQKEAGSNVQLLYELKITTNTKIKNESILAYSGTNIVYTDSGQDTEITGWQTPKYAIENMQLNCGGSTVTQQQINDVNARIDAIING